MREPNFSESQLQQAVNTAFIRHVSQLHGEWVFANVPSLCAEYDFGWDSAFYLRWLPYIPADDHEGCNFFIQYKLSGLLTSSGARQWQFWGSQYFRYKIPHSTKDANGNFVDDYHQWERLKELADRNYPTFYATNETLSKDELKAKHDDGTLIDFILLLDVRDVSGLHKFVTFTNDSRYFLLHSEKEESKKLSFSEAFRVIYDGPTSTISESNELIIEVLKVMDEAGESWRNDFLRINQAIDFPELFRPWVKRHMIASFIRKHIGAEMMWLPKNG